MSENIIQYVTAASSGDTDAMAKLYSRTLKASYFLASTLCGNKQEAAEIAKKAYARAFCNIDKLKKPEAFEIWMKQNVAAAYRETHKFVFADADAGAVENSAEFLPETVLMSDELGEKIIAAVTALRPELKTALVLYYNNGMPVQVLAKFLGVSESTANALLSKARSSVLSTSGVISSSETSEGTLPVITRLFQQKAAETVIENSDVRDIFVFAIEAYAASRPAQPAVEEPAKTEEPVKAEEPEVQEVQETEEEAPVEETVQEETPAEEEAPAQEEEAEEKQSEESEKEPEAQSEKLPDNVLMFKQRISSILDGQPSASEPEDISSVTEDVVNTKSDDDNGADIPDIPVSAGVSDSDLAEFGGISISKPKEDANIEIPKAIPYNTPEKAPSNKPAGKKIDPKMIIIAAVAALVIIVAAGFGIAKLAGGNDSGSGVSQGETEYTWVPGGFSECVEIGYLDENAAYFKSVTTGKYGLMDYQGNVILQPNYDGFVRCSVGREYDDTDSYHSLVIIGSERFELSIVNGNVTISENAHLSHSIPTTTLEDTSYDERDRYFEGYAAARKNDKWGYVSQEKDKKVIPYEYEAVNELADGETSACDYCRPVTGGLIAVKKDGKMGIINLDNDEIVPFEYSNIMPGSNGVFIACKDGIWGVILTGDAQANFTGVNFVVETLPPEVSETDDENSLGKYKVTSDDGANVRDGAGSDYDLVGELDYGDIVVGYSTKTADNGNKWLQIKLNGAYGWVAMNMLEPAE